MATYQWKGAGYGLPKTMGNFPPLQRKIDIPAIIAGGADGGLALVAAPTVGSALATTGFTAADILEVFWVPKGTKVSKVGVWVITGEGGAATIDIGCCSATQTEDETADDDGWINAFDLQTAGVSLANTDATLAFGDDTIPGGVVYITDGSIDITFNTALTAAAVFVVWADVSWLDIT